MNDPAALRPLDEATDAVRRLVEYESPDELDSALRDVARAVERSLRIRLRDDAAAPDEERMSALSPELPIDRVIQSLRARDLISLEAAGRVHALERAVERAREEGARAADADVARDAVAAVRAELGAPATPEPPADVGPVAEPDPSPETASEPGPPSVVSGSPRGMAWVVGVVAVAAVIGFAWVVTRGDAREYDRALTAFRAGQLDSAAARLERVVEDRPGDVTARLYLARTYRRLDRPEEAAELLRETVERAPDDADVRRELGHLFMDFGRPSSAVRQYERAVEQDPESPLNWAGLIRALRADGDPRAETLLREAPPEVRDALGAGADAPAAGPGEP